ncbi:MAG: hypothetical protein V4622_07245 [Bacteroidota bacterium]
MKNLKKTLQNNRKLIYAFLFLISISPFFIPKKIKKPSPLNFEKFDLNLSKINSIDKAISYIEKTKSKSSKEFDTITYIQNVESFVQNRFYHGLSSYSVSENWISHIAGKVLWNHFSAIVIPDDIMTYPEGLCSQQSIVFMEILAEKKIMTRHIGWGKKGGQGHFLVEVFYEGDWHLYDVNMEPEWENVGEKTERKSMSYFIKNKDVLYEAYRDRFTPEVFKELMTKIKFGEIDTYPAKKMRILHYSTEVFVYLIPLFLLIMLIKGFNQKLNKKN